MGTEFAVRTRNLSKLYGSRAAVSHINMEVKTGDIYGFIGRNGSGKSTTLKMCCGLVHPNEGEIALYGKSVKDKRVRKRVGMLIEDAGLYPGMSAYDNMVLNAKCKGLTDLSCIDSILKMMNLSDAGRQKTKNFSMGMKQRLGIAMALLGNPDLLILDEPINGLDPEGIREIRECLVRLNEDSGKTILISSHILGELSRIATCYGIIKDGELIEQISKEKLEEKCKEYLNINVDRTDKAAALLSEHYQDIFYEVYDQHQIHIYDFPDSSEITTMLVQNGVQVYACNMYQMDLEQYFFELMEGGAAHA